MSEENNQDLTIENDIKSLPERIKLSQEQGAVKPEVMKDKEQRLAEIVKTTALLPTEARRAVCWIVENIDFIEQIVDRDFIPEPKMEKYVEDARQRKDYFMLAIMLYKQGKGQNEAEKHRDL